jgi:Raf kinase inhibitor-like YbhB/YbcL family protein
MTRPWIFLMAAAAALAACNGGTSTAPSTNTGVAVTATPTVTLRAPGTGAVPALAVTSSSFSNGGAIPAAEAQNGCGGTNVSPNLSWSGAPAATQSFVVTEFDPDAPTGVGFWHWIAFNIPAGTTSIAAGTSTPPGTAGLNDYGATGYGGPCPPAGDGSHRYMFTVSALDTVLTGMPSPSTGAYVTFNMRGHIIAQGSYLGTFAR